VPEIEVIMRLIQEVADQELVWRQPTAMKEHYELRAGDEVLATLQWQRSWASTLATAHTAEGAWTFKRSGFWQQRIGVRPLDSEREVATFVPDWKGNGLLTVGGERTFNWVGKGFWGLEKMWQEREDAPPLIGFKHQSALKTAARVILSPTAAALPETTQLDDLYRPLSPDEMGPLSASLAELPLLVTLGFYLMVLEVMDATAAAATT
jgi:hypothetical protein